MDTNIEDFAKEPFIWGIKLVEKQNHAKLFTSQFSIGVCLLFLFEPWKLSFYFTLKAGLLEFLMTSRINYHGNARYSLLVLSRTIIALIPFVPAHFERYRFGLFEDEAHRMKYGYTFIIFSLAINYIGSFGADFGGFKFQLEFLLDLYWMLWGMSVFIFWWIIASDFRIGFREYDISNWNVWFLLAAIFFLGESSA